MMAMWRHTCSKHYILGVVASLLILIVATLAPGTRKSGAIFINLKENLILVSGQ
jgi:hypothetical protein